MGFFLSEIIAIQDPGAAPKKRADRLWMEGYFPRAAITVSKTMTTKRPADETAAAVSSPEIAEAMLSPARTSMMMNSTMMPRGVLIMLIIVPPLFLGKVQTPPPKTDGELG